MTTARRRLLSITVIIVLVASAAAFVSIKGCSSPPSIANRDPVGERFPAVEARSLEDEPLRLPEDLAGAPAILIVGYVQGAQFDIDRWLMSLLRAGVGARILEVPTIPGIVPTMISGWIDDGMRAGIPREDWGSVATLYGGAAQPVAELTGTERPRNARVIVLDTSGFIVWFDDEGFSARKALEVTELAGGLGGSGTGARENDGTRD